MDKKSQMQNIYRSISMASKAKHLDDNTKNKDEHTVRIWMTFIFTLILVLQLAYYDIIFHKIGLGVLSYKTSVINVFIGATLVQVISLVAIILKYFFKIEKK